VHGDRQPDHVGDDHRAARPGLDRPAVVRGHRLLDFLQQVQIDERTLFDRTWHVLFRLLGASRDASISSFLLLLAVANDHVLRPLVRPRLVALGGHTPRRNRMTAAGGAAFAAAVRVIDRVHRDAAHGRPDAAPALRARLAELAQVVLIVADLADRRAAIHVHLTHLARAQPHGDVRALARDDLHRRAGAARELRTFAGLQLDAM